MKKLIPLLCKAAWLLSCAFLCNCQGQKLNVLPDMVVAQTFGPGAASATALFDGDTSTHWFPGWAAQAKYPAVLMLDLGGETELTSIRLFDGYAQPTVTFAAATSLEQPPVEFLRVPLVQYQSWSEHQVSQKARYLYLSLSDAQHPDALAEVEIFVKSVPVLPPAPHFSPPKLARGEADKVNVCGFHWVPLHLLHPFRAQRIFQMSQWTWRPGNKIMVEPSFQAAANYDAYYAAAKKQGLHIVPCINQTPDWLLEKWHLGSDADAAPADPAFSATDPMAYRDFAAYWFQIAARYGRNVWPEAALQVEGTPRWTGDPVNVPKSGLNLLRYVEVWNEPDKWWKPALYIEPEQYCALLSACYDGHEGKLGPGCGIKTADSTMQVLMAGLAISSRAYLDRMLVWARANRRDQRLPCDIVNVHHYSSKGDGSNWTAGAAPETDGRFFLVHQATNWAHALGLPLWLTEFGYDVKAPSPQYVEPFGGQDNEHIRAEWLTRFYLESMAAGVDNLFVFNAIDEPGAAHGGLYQSSGLMTGAEALPSFSPKPAYHALEALIRDLEGYVFERDISPGAQVRALVFRRGQQRKVAYWSPTSEGKNFDAYIGWSKVKVSEKPRFMSYSPAFLFGL